MGECPHPSTVLAVRARERTDVWGTLQVHECRECGRRFVA